MNNPTYPAGDGAAWFSEPHGYNFNGYLVCHGEGNLCIDPVQPSDECLANIARIGTARILLANRNHSRAAYLVRTRTGLIEYLRIAGGVTLGESRHRV